MSVVKSKLGRNELCECGSGLKYKKCCLETQSSVTQSAILQSQKRLFESAEELLGDRVTLYQNEPEIKMSEVILDLADDFIMTAKTRRELKNIVMSTCTAWNLAEAFPPEKHLEEIERFIHEMLGDEVNDTDIQAFIQLMIQRKTEKYPDVHRFIVDFELIGKPNDFHLNVASSFRVEDAGLIH